MESKYDRAHEWIMTLKAGQFIKFNSLEQYQTALITYQLITHSTKCQEFILFDETVRTAKVIISSEYIKELKNWIK